MDIFEELIEQWMEEFGRAVEMFTGEKPVLTSSQAAGDLTGTDIAEHTWWKQVIENGSPFTVWAGATESLWNAFGEGQDAESTFFEMLTQANQGIAAAFSAGFSSPLRCQDGLVEAPVLPLQMEWAKIRVGFRGTDLGVIFLLVEKAAFAILDSRKRAGAAEIEQREAVAGIVQSPAMLARLLDLRLPVSILLGRARISIKDALKLMPGSVVELDRRVGDYVEILVHGTVVARGEIVSVKGNYGVRIKEVISRQDRMALHEAA
jgi:flagellar motor switch protein FliN/FliY